MSDLFQQTAQKTTGYDAKDIEVLEGLEPVRCRPGMYIGGTDERALHHLASELLDNSMDEAIAGHASLIEVELFENGSLMVKDNGRGIPVDPHPKFPEKSALEVILTTLHSGGKFGGNAYSVSGGLHGVGLSVVNALSESLTIEVARDKTLWSQSYSRGIPLTSLVKVGNVNNRRGTMISFVPDDEIFGSSEFSPAYLYRMARSKAYLHKGVKIKWTCASSLMKGSETIPENTELSFPNGLKDFLEEVMRGREVITEKPFTGEAKLADNQGHIEWAATWPERSSDGFLYSYCNTIPTPQGGTHENGFKTALYKGLRAYAELIGNKKAGSINADDVIGGAGLVLSLFIKNPLFQGQTKEKLSNPEATRLVETAIRDHFDHWLTRNPDRANSLLEYAVDNAEERLSRRRSKEMSRKSATKRLRLPGKLTDCTRSTAIGAELFIVEGDSAGGSAKQARNRLTQAILPLRGKILNVASATAEKIRNNSEISDIIEALGCGTRDNYDEESLRYEKVIIMTDADVDGAHIASLLMTFFYQEMLKLIENGHLYLAVPPLYRITQGGKSAYAVDDEHKNKLMKTTFKGKGKIDISRFKGLGEMPAAQLKETTMSPEKRTLLRVTVPLGRTEDDKEEAKNTAERVQHLMGRKPELRFRFILEHAKFVENLDI